MSALEVWSKAWPILMDKGALALLVGGATLVINKRIERFKAEQARLQDFRRERDKVIGDFLEAVAEFEMDGLGWYKGVDLAKADPSLRDEHRALAHAHELKCLVKLERARPWIGRPLYDAGNSLRGAVTIGVEESMRAVAPGTPDVAIATVPWNERANAIARTRADFYKAVAGEFQSDAGRYMRWVKRPDADKTTAPTGGEAAAVAEASPPLAAVERSERGPTG
jgi:hypothetical protein